MGKETLQRQSLCGLWFQRIRVHDGGVEAKSQHTWRLKQELSHEPPISRKQRGLSRNVTVASLYTFKTSYSGILPSMRSHLHQPKQHHQLNNVFKLPESIRDIFIKTTAMY